MVDCPLLVRWVVGLIPIGGPIELFLVSACTTNITKAMVCTILSVGRKEMFYLTTHSTHYIYGYMASDIW